MDREKEPNRDSESSWDNEPSRSQPGDLQGDKGRSSNIERESESDLDDTERSSVNRGEMEH
ncbi:MAG TPA: hypothetical protein VII32_06540 [Thermoanaerobaculia bacterium]